MGDVKVRMGGKTIHMCISVRGMLNWDRREAKRNLKWITRDDGTRFSSIEEFKNSLIDEISKGREVLPLSECDNFDYKTGCRGHVSAENPTEQLQMEIEEA